MNFTELLISFLILIGTMLIANGLGFHIPRGYVYFAMGFSFFVEFLNTKRRNIKKRKNNEKNTHHRQ